MSGDGGLSGAKRLDGNGSAGVHGQLKEDLLDLIGRAAIPQGADRMRLQLRRPAAARQHGQRDQAANVSVESWAGPDLTPDILVKEILELRRKRIGLRPNSVNVFSTENFAADR